MEKFLTGTGQKLLVHDKSKCENEYCCIHNPSNHHMKDWPLHWREDRGFFERIDPEGVGHPDPDDIEYHKKNGINISVHGCNGLCHHKNYEKYLKEQEMKIDWKEELKYFLKEKGILEVFLLRTEQENDQDFDNNFYDSPFEFIVNSFTWEPDNINWSDIDDEWKEYYKYWKDEIEFN